MTPAARFVTYNGQRWRVRRVKHVPHRGVRRAGLYAVLVPTWTAWPPRVYVEAERIASQLTALGWTGAAPWAP